MLEGASEKELIRVRKELKQKQDGYNSLMQNYYNRPGSSSNRQVISLRKENEAKRKELVEVRKENERKRREINHLMDDLEEEKSKVKEEAQKA